MAYHANSCIDRQSRVPPYAADHATDPAACSTSIWRPNYVSLSGLCVSQVGLTWRLDGRVSHEREFSWLQEELDKARVTQEEHQEAQYQAYLQQLHEAQATEIRNFERAERLEAEAAESLASHHAAIQSNKAAMEAIQNLQTQSVSHLHLFLLCISHLPHR
jgi:hypothetical protein